MKAKLSRVDGTVVPGREWNISPIVPEGWRGEPLPPGAANYQSLVLQDTWGAPRRDPSELFIGDVPVGAYTFEAEFNLSLRGERAAVVHADPVRFVIRPATPAEDAE